MKAEDYFALPSSLERFARFFPPAARPWEWVAGIAAALASVTPEEWDADRPQIPSGVLVEGMVYLHPTVKLPPYAVISGPAWIGPDTSIRPGALIRGGVIAGAGCVLGNACEYKSCLLMDKVQTPHYNYVGDSVLGSGSHLGAGAICSNLRLDQQPITVRSEQEVFATGLRKFGAILGEKAEVGCNAVLNPGTLLGRRALVMPAMAFGGVLAANTIASRRTTVALISRRD